MPSVELFVTCIVDSLYPEAGEAVVDVLEGQGVTVVFNPGQTCCGQPAYNAGFRKEAVDLALRVLDLYEDSPHPIVCPSGSCTAMIRHGYPDLFAGDPENLARAKRLAARTFEFSQFLVEQLGVLDLSARFDGTLAYHPSCHLLRGVGVKDAPVRLLERVRGARLVELPDAQECCGFGGLFSVKHADISGAMLERKLAAVRKSGAEALVSCDAGCLTHIAGGLSRDRLPVRCMHLAEVLVNR